MRIRTGAFLTSLLLSLLAATPALADDCVAPAAQGVTGPNQLIESTREVVRLLVIPAIFSPPLVPLAPQSPPAPGPAVSPTPSSLRMTRVTREGATDPYYVVALGGANGVQAQGGSQINGSRYFGTAALRGGVFRLSGHVDLTDSTRPVVVETNDWNFIQGVTGSGVRIGAGSRVGVRAEAGTGGPLAGYGVSRVSVEPGSGGMTFEFPEGKGRSTVFMNVYTGPELTLRGGTVTVLPVVDTSLGFTF